jgi:hypothetical protein
MKVPRPKSGKTIIQVPLEQDLLERIDAAAQAVHESRASYIRDACRVRLQAEEVETRERRYIEGYRKKPERLTWARTAAKLLAKALPAERW